MAASLHPPELPPEPDWEDFDKPLPPTQEPLVWLSAALMRVHRKRHVAFRFFVVHFGE